MSSLIEDSLSSEASLSQRYFIYLMGDSVENKKLGQLSLSYSRQNKKQIEKQVNLPGLVVLSKQDDWVIRKFESFTLIIFKKVYDTQKFVIEGIIYQNNKKFFIRHKNKRILFGKEWMKKKLKSNIKLSLNFSTGQITMAWPQIFYKKTQSALVYTKLIRGILIRLFNQFVAFFEKQLVPTIKRVVNCCEKIFDTKNGYSFIQGQYHDNNQQKVQIERIQKYLYMSTVSDTFSKDRQSYKNLQDNIMRQKQNIMKVQRNIDMTFSNIKNELILYTSNQIGNQKRKLAFLGILQSKQIKILEELCSNGSCRSHNRGQQQFILNRIGILKAQNQKRFVSSGGSCNIFMIKIYFQYIFSDDLKYWIQQNKKTCKNVVQKSFIVKQAKEEHQQKIRHQNQIIKQMKSGFSIYLPRYYKVENITNKQIGINSDDFILMDYLKGQTLDTYIKLNSTTLSFWTKIFIVKNILCVLRFISAYKIVHLDLKPSNIVVVGDLLTKLIDFGQSYHPKVCQKDYIPGISLPYCCPQIQYNRSTQYDEKCDVFSLGVIIFEILFQSQIFQLPKDKIVNIYRNQSYMQRIYICPQKLQRQNLTPIFNIMLTLTMRCLHPNPQFRPTLNWLSVIIGQLLIYFRGK